VRRAQNVKGYPSFVAHSFTPEETRRGAEVSNAKQAAIRAERDRRSLVVWEIVSEVDDLAPATLAAALRIVEQVAASGAELPVESWLDAQRAANAAEIIHRISRLASNQSTSNVASQKVMSDDERRELLARLRGTAASQPDSAPGDTAT
jgi:hypothetical protein